MQITSVSYSRLFSLGNYENEKIGATATVDLDAEEQPGDVLQRLREWVELHGNLAKNDREASEQLGSKQYELLAVTRRIENAKAVYAKVRGILSMHGLDIEDMPQFDDLPF